MFDLMRDVRHAARRLVRTPVFTLATLLTLALGIGANTAIFSVVNSVLLKPLPFPEPDRLVGLWQTAPGVNINDLNASIADYVTYREESQTLADVAIWNRNAFTVTGVGGAGAGGCDQRPPSGCCRCSASSRSSAARSSSATTRTAAPKW